MTLSGGRPQMANGLTEWDSFIEGVPLVAYWLLVKSHWRIIAIGASLALLGTFITTEFFMRPSYRATAVLRPVPPENGAGKLNGTLGMLNSGGLGAGNMFGGGAQNEQAQEYIAMLRSYAFTIAVVSRYHLEPHIAPASRGHLSRWRLYRMIGGRFDCEYDRLTGNLTLHFVDHDPAAAQRILGLYVDSLREKLRRREIQSANAAKASLEEAARTTPDLLLQEKLYELIARQVEREKLAQVEANFAFVMIEPPVVSDDRYGPRVVRDSAIAGALALLMLALAVVAHDSWTRSLRLYHHVVASRRDSSPVAARAPATAG